MLRAFVANNREEILARARLRVAARNAPAATELELSTGLPMFLDQLCEALRKAAAAEESDHVAIAASAGEHAPRSSRRSTSVSTTPSQAP